MRCAVALILVMVPLACVSRRFDDGQLLCDAQGSADVCPSPLTCASDGRCRASGTCFPKTCDDLAPACGALDDGCGHPLACGCVTGAACDLNGPSGICICHVEGTAKVAASEPEGGGIAWSKPEKALVSDNVSAEVLAIGPGKTTERLGLTDWGIKLPSGVKEVWGFEVFVERRATGTEIYDNGLRLTAPGWISDIRKLVNVPWPSSDAKATYGYRNDLWTTMYDGQWFAKNAILPTFGVRVRAENQGTKDGGAFVDSVKLRVHYPCPK
jgi:hypothetical protein